jgi:hypothetical protein
MNRKELAKVLNVSATAVGNWENEGMPIKRKGGRGRQNEYDLDECTAWLMRNGKGQSVRVDRQGAATRVNELTKSAGRPAEYLKLTEEEISEALGAALAKGGEAKLEWIAENFLIASAALMKFAGFSAKDAVHLGFRIAGTFHHIGADIFSYPDAAFGPSSRVRRYLQRDPQAMAEFEHTAEAMQDMWDTAIADGGKNEPVPQA